MLDYSVPDKTLKKLEPHSRVVQCAIAVIANELLGSERTARGIFKYEGGVLVNGREICIRKRFVIDDRRKPTEATAEETAVVSAINQVVELWNKGGEGALTPYAAQANPILMGDPLRAMFG